MIRDECKNKNITIIEQMMSENNGYVTTKQVVEKGIHRMYLELMLKQGIIERVDYGVYIDSKKIEDKYYVFSIRTPNAVFSHMTALYFHGLSIKAPDTQYDITLKRGYHNVRLVNHNCFYAPNDLFGVGIEFIETPMNNKIRVYDIERCICDIIRSKGRMDLEHVKYSVKQYIKRKDKDLIKLSKYAEEFGIKEEVMDFISMMYE